MLFRSAPSTYQGGGTTSTNYFKTIVTVPGGDSDTIYGEWLQIQLPTKLRISKYSILTPEIKFITMSSKANKKPVLLEEEDIEANMLSNKYQQKTDKQHILDNPDTYIGSIENINANMWIMNNEGKRIFEKNISYIPGLFKLFDEGIVNCRDHVVRMQTAINSGVPNSLPVTNIEIGRAHV